MRRAVFQAIADPRRRGIISLIAKRPMTPNPVAESFRLSRQAISKHSHLVAECGLLSLDTQQKECYYSMQAEKLIEVNEWLDPSVKYRKPGLKN
jgi:DNA-binding transcriptional ArsR family regulator